MIYNDTRDDILSIAGMFGVEITSVIYGYPQEMIADLLKDCDTPQPQMQQVLHNVGVYVGADIRKKFEKHPRNHVQSTRANEYYSPIMMG